MSGQREGFLGDMLDKVKDLIDGDNKPKPNPNPDPDGPILEPQCCGHNPKFAPVGLVDLNAGEPVRHEAGCPNHPDNMAAEVKA